jgi:putative membrane-bound dehydrogenase-like protein
MRAGIRGGAALVIAVGLCSGARPAEPPSTQATPLDRAVAGITVPEGFRVSLFAGEPDIRQPIGMAFDTKGRLWVVECYAYPQWEMNGKPGRDRVLIFEDTDGDGKFDTRTVFLETGTNLSGIELGFGGVWLCSTPNLLFIPDRNRDDKPDGPAEVVLDGWNLRQAGHNVFNGLVWGPDGWLWGCNGIQSNSKVGRPGTPDAQRTPINCGIWRYHPTRKVFEAVAHGTTNPWGLDFDDYGEAFLTNCVIPHIFHVVPGGHYTRMYGQDMNPHSYELIKTCGDHIHWDTTEHWTDIRSKGVTPTTDTAGGGHAHSGAAVCLSDTWPEKYRNTVVMGNIHGNRLNMDRLDRVGGNYIARHMPDFMRSSDTWFRSVAQRFGPDGSLYVLDWSDTGECHESDADGAHRENGRIYRVTNGRPRSFPEDLAKLDNRALASLQLDKDDGKVRLARRLLQERAAAGDDLAEAHGTLRSILTDHREDTRKLRALWALNASGGIDRDGLIALFKDKSEYVRAWALRLMVDDRPEVLTNDQLAALVGMISAESSPKVAMAAASALPYLPVGKQGNLRILLGMGVMEVARREVQKSLQVRQAAAPGEPALSGLSDAFVKAGYPDGGVMLSALIWYAIEPAIATGQWDGLPMMLISSSAGFPRIQHDLARRMVEVDQTRGLTVQTALLAKDVPSAVADPILQGIADALEGRKAIPMPALWPELRDRSLEPGRSDDPNRLSGTARVRIWRLSLLFKDATAAARLRTLLADPTAPAENRRGALEALAAFRIEGVVNDLLARLDDPILRDDALRALSAFDEPKVPTAILDRYKSLSDKEKEDAVATLATRPKWALALLDAVAKSVVPREDVSATVARQLLAFNRAEITKALENAWGVLRPTAKDKVVLLARYKQRLAASSSKTPDLARGRQLFQKTCQQCHKMYGDGGDVGPELTGSNRDNLDYVLENVLDPSASVANDYRVTTVATTDGRLLSGIVKERTDAALVLRTPNDRVVVPRDEIEAENATPSSMMPEGLIEKLDDDELRDLIAYLAAKR